jgi:hypothetical protein
MSPLGGYALATRRATVTSLILQNVSLESQIRPPSRFIPVDEWLKRKGSARESRASIIRTLRDANKVVSSLKVLSRRSNGAASLNIRQRSLCYHLLGLSRMPRQRSYATDADRQAAYRKRHATRKRDVTIRDSDFLECIEFIRDCAGDVERASIANWAGWKGAEAIHCHALQQDLDDLVSRLDALLHGDNAPFQGPEWADWKARRDARLKIN